MFCKNISSFDRLLRLIIGIVLIVLTLTHTIGLWGWIGIIPILSSLLGFCPLYLIVGKKSCNTKP